MCDVDCSGAPWRRSPVPWRDVLQKLHADPARPAQRGDMQVRSEDIVQVLLLEAVVVTFTGNVQAQEIAVELQASISIRYGNGRVVDAEEQPAVSLLPLRITLARRELQNLQRMTVAIAEVECLDAGCGRIPIGQPLRIRRNVLHLVLSQH